MERLAELVGDSRLWVGVAIGCFLWWLFALGIARLEFRAGRDPLEAARSGARLGVWAAVLFVAAGSWLLWQQTVLSVLMGALVAALTVAVLIVMLRFEPVSRG